MTKTLETPSVLFAVDQAWWSRGGQEVGARGGPVNPRVEAVNVDR